MLESIRHRFEGNVMDWHNFHNLLLLIQHIISFIGVFIILLGVLYAFSQFLFYAITGQLTTQGIKINAIRMNLGRVLILGLEFIVAADLIGTTTAPDYYSVGILAIIVLIRTLLSYTINRELTLGHQN
jgi:uncharacterized membrane protein